MLRVLHFVRDAGLDDSIFICSFKTGIKKPRGCCFSAKPCVEPIKKCGYFSLCVLWSSPKIRSSMSGRLGFCGIGKSSHDVMPSLLMYSIYYYSMLF